MTKLHRDQTPRVTRDPDVPPEDGQLFQMLNHCCVGHTHEGALCAALNLVVAAIIEMYRTHPGGQQGRALAMQHAGMIADQLVGAVDKDYARAKLATDIDVPHGN